MHKYSSNTHSMAIGYVMWIFGFFGMHRFYYGKPISGVIWLFTGGLLGIGWIMDVFLIPAMDAEADNRYAQGPIDYSIAWLLLLFLGMFGIHHFYTGNVVLGIIWLLTGGLCGFGILYDFCTLNDQVDELNRAHYAG